MSTSDGNVPRVLKWGYLLAREYGARGVRVEVGRSGPDAVLTVRAAGSHGGAVELRYFGGVGAEIHGPDGSLREYEHFERPELRTEEVLPWLRTCVERLPLSDRRSPAEAARQAASLGVLGHFAAHRPELDVRPAPPDAPAGFFAWPVPGHAVGDLFFLASGLVLHRSGTLADALDLAIEQGRPTADWLARLDRFHDEGTPPSPGCHLLSRWPSAMAAFPHDLESELALLTGGRVRRIVLGATPDQAPVEAEAFAAAVGRLALVGEGACRYLVADDGLAQRWPPDAGAQRFPLIPPAKAGAMSTSGPLLCGHGPTLAWFPVDGSRFQVMSAAPGQPPPWIGATAAAFSATGNGSPVGVAVAAGRLVVGSTAGRLEVRRLADGAERTIAVSTRGAHPSQLSLDPTGRIAALTSDHVCLVDLDTGRTFLRLTVSGRARLEDELTTAFTPDGRHLLVAAQGGLGCFDLVTRETRLVAASPHPGGAVRLALSCGGRWLAVTSPGGAILLDWGRLRADLDRLPACPAFLRLVD